MMTSNKNIKLLFIAFLMPNVLAQDGVFQVVRSLLNKTQVGVVTAQLNTTQVEIVTAQRNTPQVGFTNLLGQQCKRDTDCDTKAHCCSRYGFCGEDEGFCSPNVGCLLKGIEIKGGDLHVAEGGGGLSVDKGDLDGCSFICEETSQCKWYTYDKQSNLCYLKSARGYLNNSTDMISGSTQSGGCVSDGGCHEPYKREGNRCLHYSQDYPQWGVALSNNRRGFKQAAQLCDQYSGNIPYSFLGSEPRDDIGSLWHWLNYPAVGDTCLAIRPGRYQDGAAYFPCNYKFNMACEQSTTFPLPIPSFPRIVRLTNINQYNFIYRPCPQTVINCRGRWVGGNPSQDYDDLDSGYNVGGLGFTSGCPDNGHGHNIATTSDVQINAHSRPIIIVNNNEGMRKSVRESMALAAGKNPYLKFALAGNGRK